MKTSTRGRQHAKRRPKADPQFQRGEANESKPFNPRENAPPARPGKAALLKQYLPLIFLSAIALLGAISLQTIYARHWADHPIRSDGEGYYAYLGGLTYRDVSLCELIGWQYHGEIPGYAGINFLENPDRFLIKYPMGMAVLMLPFYLLGGLASLLAGSPLDGYSWPFQWAAALSGLFYVVAGLGLLWKLLARRFQPGTVFLTLTGVVFATNLFHYATFDSVFSHAYSFFLFTL